MSRQSLKARKALRSASAKKGWDTRRERADTIDRAVEHGVRLCLGRQMVTDTWLMPAARTTDPNPWPRIAAAIRRGWQRVCGWFRPGHA